MQSQEANKVKEIEEEVDKIKGTTIIVDKADKIIKITTAIKEIIVDKVNTSQETLQDNSITYTAGYVNNMDTILYSGVQSSQNTFLKEVTPRVSHGLSVKNA